MATKKENAAPARRSFLNILWMLLGGVALAEFVVVAFAFLRPSKSTDREKDTRSFITVGAVDSFTSNSVTAFVRGKFYLARLEGGGFLALSRTCPHLGLLGPLGGKRDAIRLPLPWIHF